MECSDLRKLLLPLLASDPPAIPDNPADPAVPVPAGTAPATPASVENIGLLMKKFNVSTKAEVWKGALCSMGLAG